MLNKMLEDKLVEDEKEERKKVLSKIMIICFTYKTHLNRPHFIKINYVF